MRHLILLILCTYAYATTCDLETIDYANMCNECSKKKSCAKKFGINSLLDGSCSSEDNKWFNTSIKTLKQVCEPTIQTTFSGTVDCKILAYVAEGFISDCGPTCGLNEYLKVNARENTVYCACDGKCLEEFQDSTLNNLIITLIVLFLTQSTFNFIIMLNTRFKFGLFGNRYTTIVPVVGKTV